jgi:hypothetical protein
VAAKFNGTDQGLSVGGARGQFRNVAASTIACWARVESAMATDRVFMKFSTATGSNTTRVSFGLSANLAGIAVGCRILDADALSSHAANFGTPPGIGEWHHYAVAFDFSVKRFYIYYDGALFNSTQMVNPTAGNTSDTASLSGGIGIANPPTGNSFFPGSLDDVIFFNRLLGPAEIQTIYGSRGRDFILRGITGRWQLAEGGEGVAIATAVDVTGLGGSASPIGAPVYTGGTTARRRRPRMGAGARR